MEDIKAMIRDAEGTPYIALSHGLTMSEFMSLHLHFIQRGRSETTWKMLRKFGYDDDLHLSESYLHPKFELSPDCTLELNPKSSQFIIELFKKYDMVLIHYYVDSFLNPLFLGFRWCSQSR